MIKYGSARFQDGDPGFHNCRTQEKRIKREGPGVLKWTRKKGNNVYLHASIIKSSKIVGKIEENYEKNKKNRDQLLAHIATMSWDISMPLVPLVHCVHLSHGSALSLIFPQSPAVEGVWVDLRFCCPAALCQVSGGKEYSYCQPQPSWINGIK